MPKKSLNSPIKIYKRYRKVLKNLDVWLIEFIGREFAGDIDDYQKSHNTKRWKWPGGTKSWDTERRAVDNIIEVVLLQTKNNFNHSKNLVKSLDVVCGGQSYTVEIPLDGKNSQSSI